MHAKHADEPVLFTGHGSHVSQAGGTEFIYQSILIDLIKEPRPTHIDHSECE
jgi:hypothetical protein